MQKSVHGRACPSMPGGERGCRLFINQTMLVMKLTMVLLTASILTVHANGLAQKITFSGKNVTLLKIFSAIETQTGYFTVGSLNLLNNATPVSLNVKDMPLDAFLKLALSEQPIDFRISENTIFLSRKPGVIMPDTQRPALTTMPVIEIPPPIKVKGKVVGLNGIPLYGASIGLAGSSEVVLTDAEGQFELVAEKGQKLVISYVGYQTSEWKVTSETMKIELKPADNKLDDVEVVINTGYQKFKPNEMVGAVEVITAKDLQKQVGSNILQRLRGLSTALQFNNKTTTSSKSGNPHSVLNMSIRGWSTINGPTDPLIILDNFPYDGNIDNINPNDVESIIILKDAAATSIWGARAGNGVIVITTKRGKFGSKPSFSFTSAVGITEKPDLNRLPLLGSGPFIDQELKIANQNGLLLDQNQFTYSPAVNVLIERKRGLISAADSAAKIDYLKSIDSKQQWNKYIYRNAISQDYSLSASGGAANMSWNISGNYNRSMGRAQDQYERKALNLNNGFKVTSKIDLFVDIRYSNLKTRSGAPEFNSVKANNYTSAETIPYLQLADENGNPVSLLKKYSKQVQDSLGAGRLLDYRYYPLTDWKHDYTTSKNTSYSISSSLVYRPVKPLKLELTVKTMKEINASVLTRDKESYFTRELINKFSRVDPVTKVINRVVPQGDILTIQNNELNRFDLRANGIFDRTWGRHSIVLMASMDLADRTTRKDGKLMLGYSEDPLIQSMVDMTGVYPVPFEGDISVGYALGANSILGLSSFNERQISTLGSFSYSYNSKYIFYSSIRRDGANILGVKTNEKWKPLWSIGGKWVVDKEKFIKPEWINRLVLRGTVGISGNVDVSKTSNPVGTISQGLPNSTQPFPYITIQTPPNPNLRWEKKLETNLAMDISVLHNRINATVEYFFRKTSDLYAPVLADYTQSPATMVMANAGIMSGKGYDVSINAKLFDGPLEWITNIRFSHYTSKVENYLTVMTPGSTFNNTLGNDGNTFNDKVALFPGQSLFGISAVRTAGLNNQGQLQYLVNGKITTNFNEVVEDFETNGDKASSYLYYRGEPKLFFNFDHMLNWRNWNLTVMAQVRLGYYFKKMLINNGENLNSPMTHKDFEKQWRKPGDELFTNIPPNSQSLVLYAIYSSDNVKRADNIRIGNAQLTYDFPLRDRTRGLKSLNLALNVTNLGIIWKANKEVMDPDDRSGDFQTYQRQDRSWTLTLRAGF